MQHDQRVNILLVDDRPENLLTLEAILENPGHRLVRAHSGTEALRCLLQQDFAVVVLDVQMPGMDGFETAELIRSRERSQRIPIIFITANNTSDAHVFQGYALGAVDYLFKPVVPAMLRSKVAVFVDLFRKTEEVQRQAEQLKTTVNELEQQIIERKRAEAALQQGHDELEIRVQERTAGLAAANAALQNEIVERKRAEEGLEFLAEASLLLTTSLDYESNLVSVAHLAVPYLGDWCSVDLVDNDGEVEQLVVAGKHQDRVALLGDGLASVANTVVRTGSVGWYLNLDDPVSAVAPADATELALLRSVVGLRSVMVVPLVARERCLGAFTFAMAHGERRYTQASLQLAEDLARRAAVAIDNARLYQEAKAAVQARDAFLSVAAHELKTPLTSLLGYADLLLRRSARADAMPERDLKALRLISEQGRRLTKMIGSMLDLSRIQTGQLSIEREPVDLASVADRIVTEVQPTLDGHTLCLVQNPEPLVIEGDELRLEQVFQNLIQNAIKYSPAGGTITVEVSQRGEYGCVAVSDEGIGIPAESLPQLFSRFYRATNATGQQISGLGVGLYVVREIVTLHGGKVDVTSEEGVGSTFTVCLPLAGSAATVPALVSGVDGTLFEDVSHDRE